MDILLLSLAEIIDEDGNEKDYLVNQEGMPPLGLLYLAQMLLDKGNYDVMVYDQCVSGVKNDELLNYIKQKDPKIVGFSICLHNYFTSIDLINKIKEWNANIKIVVGNYTATFYSKKLMNSVKNVDFCIRGEGEHSFLELVNAIFKNNSNYKDIKGLTFRKNGIIKLTPKQKLIQNLNDLPIPNRELIEFDYKLTRKSTSIMTSRGCPYNCRFCYFSSIMGKKWRHRSVENIIEELTMLKNQGYKEIVFGDSNFNLSKKRTYELCSKIRKEGLDEITFSADLRVDTIDYKQLNTLVHTNFKKILFGIESGNQRILDYYRKGTTIDQVKAAVKAANKAKMEIILGSFIVGAPDETLEEVINTINFANRLDLSYVSFQILSTLPISSIYQEIVENGYHTPREDDWKKWIYVADICSDAIPRKVLSKLINEGFIRFFKNKRRFLKFILRGLNSNNYMNYIKNMIKEGIHTRLAK
ncbi:MAG: radical SAM protein [Candidatus Lokiarchaeota archaeon]|nr:radical SAM protein [Candidatus Lokiarchaeota archaeon]